LNQLKHAGRHWLPLHFKTINPELLIYKLTEEDADLIVISTHGQSGWRKFVFGSVAEKVIRIADCPVLTIRPREKASTNS